MSGTCLAVLVGESVTTVEVRQNTANGSLYVSTKTKDITHYKTRLCKIGGKVDAKDMWAAVRQLTGRQQITGPIDGITAESLNDHFAAISSDPNYSSPIRKSNLTPSLDQYVTEFQIYKILDKLRPTAMGLDGLPAWFLRLGTPAFYKPINKLFHLSLANSYVPHQ